MRCSCGRSVAVRRSQWTGGMRWVYLRRDRWWSVSHRQVTCDRVIVEDLGADEHGRAQCPHCRDMLLASGQAVPEQEQMEMAL